MAKTKLSKSHISVIVFGIALAILAVTLQFFEYRYYVGSLDTDVYTGIVAAIFTIVGIWIGMSLLKKQKSSDAPKEDKIDHEQIKQLRLNEREYEILTLISKGHTNQEIADLLFLALPTIKSHTSNLYSKLDVKSRTQAIHKAQTLNLL